MPVRRLGLGVLAQHAEQPPHLRQPGPRRVPDLRQPLRPGGRHPGRGQPGGLRLDGDHRDVVRDHVVQLTGDAGPLAAGRVLHQRARDGLRRGGVQQSLGAPAPGYPGPRRRRDQRRQHDREHPGLRPHRSAGGERQDQERHGQPKRGILRAVAADAAATPGAAAAEPVHRDQLGGRACHGEEVEQAQRNQACRRQDDGRRGRAEERQRQRGRQAEHAVQQAQREELVLPDPRRDGMDHRSPGERLDDRGQPEQPRGHGEPVPGGGDLFCPACPSGTPVSCQAHASHCRRWPGPSRPPGKPSTHPPHEGQASR